MKAGGMELLGGKMENDVLYDIDAIDADERAMQKVLTSSSPPSSPSSPTLLNMATL